MKLYRNNLLPLALSVLFITYSSAIRTSVDAKDVQSQTDDIGDLLASLTGLVEDNEEDVKKVIEGSFAVTTKPNVLAAVPEMAQNDQGLTFSSGDLGEVIHGKKTASSSTEILNDDEDNLQKPISFGLVDNHEALDDDEEMSIDDAIENAVEPTLAYDETTKADSDPEDYYDSNDPNESKTFEPVIEKGTTTKSPSDYVEEVGDEINDAIEFDDDDMEEEIEFESVTEKIDLEEQVEVIDEVVESPVHVPDLIVPTDDGEIETNDTIVEVVPPSPTSPSEPPQTTMNENFVKVIPEENDDFPIYDSSEDLDLEKEQLESAKIKAIQQYFVMGCVALVASTLLLGALVYGCYRLRKKDEGTYSIGTKVPP